MDPLKTEKDLLARCRSIEGLTFQQLASLLKIKIPNTPSARKGFVGQAVERALGTTAGQLQLPDFHELGIELKTIPLNRHLRPAESTFVTAIPLLTVHQQTWLNSQCWMKLKRVLWVPVEDGDDIAFPARRVGAPILWSPSAMDACILEQDWTELTLMIGTGRLAEIDATMGTYLQVRPKAANAKSLCYGLDEEGNQVKTIPRGFYLRSQFTAQILERTVSAQG